MVFVEVLRLVLVLLGALMGFEVGRTINSSPAPMVGLALGALAFYVIGGVLGRLLTRNEGRILRRFDRIPPGELFAGTLTAIAGVLLGLALCIPLLALRHDPVSYVVATLVVWLLGWIAFRLGVAKGRQIIAAAGLSRILAPPTEPPPGYAVLVDASAIMDRPLVVLGRAGLLVGGIVAPRFVIDQVQSIAGSPDPVASRRARRGLEMLEVLREKGVSVHIAENQVPDVERIDDRLLELARRLGLRIATCSSPLYNRARRAGLPVTDLRRLAGDLTPDIPVGEKLVIDLVRQGNQPRQAVGYLPDGDMVVVNDASHLVGREGVVVEVTATRPTSQGLLVFSRLVDRPGASPTEEDRRFTPTSPVPAGTTGGRDPEHDRALDGDDEVAEPAPAEPEEEGAPRSRSWSRVGARFQRAGSPGTD